MLTLVVDTSTSAVQAAIVDVSADDDQTSNVAVRAHRRLVDKHGHVENLTPMIQQAQEEAGIGPRDLDAVVAGIGPGPFTGLRVGMVTAAATAFALDVPVYGVCSLDGIGAETSGRTLVAADARRKEIYWAEYDNGVRVADPQVGKASALPELKADRAVGEGALLYADRLRQDVADEPRYPSLATLAAVARRRILDRAPSDEMTPLYLRRPDAKLLSEQKK
ncbi:tRNA (adenosine(37)-N6)-threonylcarbamoyltransferase complex dimerization subunit type 1 TsaB [Haloglycomyces albus]|uniref:tRNA (adenosine(37)-N6)-threonylcarbamoyltransferase complex dimerization subunit type 1 TsaB n=1 Tax=Haloglycomyces albus TaxID=526067 RepID=UPI00046D7A96|nr:tRNA (adenosine(37)-N6)-threonylcarbamoyltransferase complex dimerization subunit type 1 TsaB [Haloglycomyces albus]